MLRTQEEQTFLSAAPRLWNNMLLAMRSTDSHSSFKKQLKKKITILQNPNIFDMYYLSTFFLL